MNLSIEFEFQLISFLSFEKFTLDIECNGFLFSEGNTIFYINLTS